LTLARAAWEGRDVTPPATKTLAELYVAQGLVGRARAIYRELADGPDAAAAAAARARLDELGPSAASRIAELEALLARVKARRRSSTTCDKE
jgi:hypothetical protein